MPGSPYTILGDKQNNIWFLNFGGEHIGKIDAKTGQITLYPTPTKRSRPRRGRIDDEGRIWFAEFGGERIGMFDTKTERFKEWEVPGKFFAPYDAALDKNGNLWTGGMNADRILRLNIETGKFTEYPLPHYTNVRRVFVDNNDAADVLGRQQPRRGADQDGEDLTPAKLGSVPVSVAPCRRLRAPVDCGGGVRRDLLAPSKAPQAQPHDNSAVFETLSGDIDGLADHCLIASAAFALLPGTIAAQAQTLAGKVTSAEEGAMEGVVVSAKKGIVTVSVISNDKGEFSFPAGKLGAGDYALSIKAGGYDLDGPKTVTLDAGKAAILDVKLVKTKNLAAQLSNLEWILSVPGHDSQKRALTGCTNCHSVERILNSTYNADEMFDVIKRMATYSNNSFFLKPQVRAEARNIARFTPNGDKDADYLASINRSEGPLKYQLKTLPRVTGAGTRVVITEYDLPREDTQPHDVMVDADGIVWYSDFGDQFLGRFDPKTLQFKEYPVPVHRPEFAKGALDLEVDPQGNLWLALMFQTGVAKFDRKTETFQTWPLPPHIANDQSQQSMVGPQQLTVDGKVWLNDAGIPGMHRLDLATGKVETW